MLVEIPDGGAHTACILRPTSGATKYLAPKTLQRLGGHFLCPLRLLVASSAAAAVDHSQVNHEGLLHEESLHQRASGHLVTRIDCIASRKCSAEVVAIGPTGVSSWGDYRGAALATDFLLNKIKSLC
ncbi:hypothetical protein KHC28_11645 [Ancylobacter sonchi]|uniref:hypothetical protein n=1 Tax=Ancylobacter sonchi TaxID=1937790 RepID=UPI001BD69C62|nr:hypothetical protein [Ancylobacter sonchi]MBS7534310.1 hypothetical protein [Ancylobacter sonchi]